MARTRGPGTRRFSDWLHHNASAMAVKLKSVFETVMYEYAKLIADRAIAERAAVAPALRQGRSYWSFVHHCFRRLAGGAMSPSTVLRENKLLVTSVGQCAYCGAVGVALHWEHIIPDSRNGPDMIDNLVLSCAKCNLEKGTRNPLEWYAARGLDRSAVPRLVMGKLLKVVLEEHRARGTDSLPEFPVGAGLHLANVCLVFDFPRGATAAPSEASRGNTPPTPTIGRPAKRAKS